MRLIGFIFNLFEDDDKRIITFLAISALSLFLSFFKLTNIKPDIAWVAVILCGVPIIKCAVIGLITKFDIKADVLVSLALIASVIIGEIFAAGEVAFIMALGALLEERTVAKARAGIMRLIDLTPPTARVLRDGYEKIIPAENVRAGDILRVNAGETIAADGIIISGKTSINQSIMTGESLPADKEEGDEVLSGTINQFGTFDMKALKVGEDSSLSRMIRLVESADAGKAKIVGMADRWATWIVVIALLSATGTWMVTGEIIRAVTILVVFCPCALVLATPTAIMAGIGNATKYGILIREGDALERLAQVSVAAFDKTGTLTHGKPVVTAVKSFGGMSEGELLQLCASAEKRSEHPAGKAIVSYYTETAGDAPQDSDSFLLKSGRGVLSDVRGKKITAGNLELMQECGVRISDEFSETYLKEGCTVIYIAVNGIYAGFIALSDTIRTETPAMINELKKLRLKTVMLTGDHKESAMTIASQAGMDEVYSGCLPEEKMNIIGRYHDNNNLVCMVGDGINDAPALKKAHVGIAMGGIGSDIAVDAADIALVGDEIKHLPHLMKLSIKTMSTIKINLSLSMLLNFAAIILAMIGILNPITGALVHNAGSVAVIVNSALLLNYKTEKSEGII